jgi:hypothetical protein
MGNASSMLTQYDIEEVQEHCGYLCEDTSLRLHQISNSPFNLALIC